MNELELMNRENKSKFSILFNSLSDLRHINLSKTGLLSTPKDLFEKNGKLETIDLTRNKLQQVV